MAVHNTHPYKMAILPNDRDGGGRGGKEEEASRMGGRHHKDTSRAGKGIVRLGCLFLHEDWTFLLFYRKKKAPGIDPTVAR